MNIREIITILLSSRVGKIGVVFFILLVVVSLYVVMAYPMDFGPRSWNNPTVWADNPKNVSPAWTNIFSQTKQVAHTNFKATEPNQVTIGTNETTFFYTSKLSYDYDEFPTFTSFTIDNITYHSQPPIITLAIARPDGREILLYRHVVLGPSPSETMPISRYTETPHRVYLSGDNTVLFNITDYLRGEFDLDIAVPKLRGIIDKVIFGTPGGEGQDFSVLQGKYNIITTARTYHPDDSIGEVSFVLGGSVYGFMGTDATGRDLAVGLLFGFPIALLIGLTTAILTTIIGTAMGIISGYSGGKIDTIIRGTVDTLLTVPGLVVLISIASTIREEISVNLMALVVASLAWMWPTRTIRSQVLTLRERAYVHMAKLNGMNTMEIIWKELFPNLLPYLAANLAGAVSWAVLATIGLEALGLGPQNEPTVGMTIYWSITFSALIRGMWWWWSIPILFLALLFVSLILIAAGLDELANPKQRKAT